MKLSGVEIPPDIEIPVLDQQTKEEIDKLHEALAHEAAEAEQILSKPMYRNFYAKMKAAPQPPGADKLITFRVEALRKLPPESRARILYALRHQVTN